MTSWIECLLRIITADGFALSLGFMIASATIIGYMLHKDEHGLWKWALTGFIYLGYYFLLKYILIEENGINRITALGGLQVDVVVAVISILGFGTGIAFGMYLAKVSRTRAKVIDDEAQKTLDEIINNSKKD